MHIRHLEKLWRRSWKYVLDITFHVTTHIEGAVICTVHWRKLGVGVIWGWFYGTFWEKGFVLHSYCKKI